MTQPAIYWMKCLRSVPNNHIVEAVTKMFHAELAWHVFDGCISSWVRLQHGAQLLPSFLELHHLARRMISHDVSTQGRNLLLIEGCPQLCTTACKRCRPRHACVLLRLSWTILGLNKAETLQFL